MTTDTSTAAPAAEIAKELARAKLFEALAKAQGAFGRIEKNRTVSIKPRDKAAYSFRYADLDEILAKTRKPLSDNGLGIMSLVDERVDDGRIVRVIRTMLFHAGGATISATLTLAKSDGEDIKEFGGRVSYLRRYQTQAMLGVAADDDADEDGQAGGSGPGASPDPELDADICAQIDAAKSISALSQVMLSIPAQQRSLYNDRQSARAAAIKNAKGAS